MSWRESFSKEPFRSYSILGLMALGMFVALPIPIFTVVSLEASILILLWMSLAAFATASFFQSSWTRSLGSVSFVLSFVHALTTGFWPVFFAFVVVVLWARRRFAKHIALVLFGCLMVNASAQVPGIPAAPQFRLDDLASCGSLDKIPWQFRPDGRRIRKLFEEELRLANDNETFWWELYQIMNAQGDVTFIFRRSLPDGSYMSLAARDLNFVRVLSTPEQSKKLENQTFKHLINRPALIFYRADGTIVNYMPGSVGKATIQIQFAITTGAYLPPVYIRGNFCDRPASLSEADLTSKNFGKVKNQGTPSTDDSKK